MVSGPRQGVLWALSITALLLASALPITQLTGPTQGEDLVPFSGSNSGVVPVVDAASTIIYGVAIPPPGDLLGSYIWIGEVNGDGIDDIAFTSTTDGVHPGVNFVYGRNVLPPVIDQADGFPVSASLEYSPRNMDSCDINNDGIPDLVIAEKLSGFISRGNGAGGWDRDINSLLTGCPQPVHEFPYGDFIWTGDIDQDERDDIIAGIFGLAAYEDPGFKQSDTVTIRWSGGNGTTTIIAEDYDDFGSSIDIGDIDGDGKMDMVIGAPKTCVQEGYKDYTGALYVFFNITGLKGSTDLIPGETANITITGSDLFDQFGWNARLEDINGDGLDDIVTGSPNAGGPLNSKPGAGEILVYYGKNQRSFPFQMDAENDADLILIGSEGASKDPYYSGDKIGRIYDIADMDGNGDPEIIISIPTRNLEPLNGIDRTRAGAVCVYEFKEIIPPIGTIIQLSYPSRTFTIEGMDSVDSFGWQVRTGDVNGDGFDDLLIGAPMGDGPSNARKSSGEIYVILGEGVRLEDLTISGPGSTPPKLFANGGMVDLNLSFRSSRGFEHVAGGEIMIGNGENAVTIILEAGTHRIKNDPMNTLALDPGGTKITGIGEKGWFSTRFEMDWHFPFKGNVDVHLSLVDIDGKWINRSYPEPLIICKDVFLDHDISVKANGKEIRTLGSYIASSSSISISGARMKYKDEMRRQVPYGAMDISIGSGGVVQSQGEYVEDWSLEAVLPERTDTEYVIRPVLPDRAVPGGIPEEHLPDLGSPVLFLARIDEGPPDKITGLKAFSKYGSLENISSTGEYTVSWDGKDPYMADMNQSGIKAYHVFVDDAADPIPVMESGGLIGTYYDDLHFYDRVKNQVDPRIHFTLKDWGEFGPDPNWIPPTDYSMRWHGYLSMDGRPDQYLKLIGSGEAKVYIDGEIALEWTPVSNGAVIGSIDLSNYVARTIEMYFRHRSGPSYLSLHYQDGSGIFSPVPSEYLFHPSNRTSIITSKDVGQVRVRAVDWIGAGTSSSITLYTDASGPVFDLSGNDRWVRTPYPVLSALVWDPGSEGGPNSDLDLGSLGYRIRRENETWSEWMECSSVEIADNSSDPVRYRTVFEPMLDPTWYGYYQVQAYDRSGNHGLSTQLVIGVDVRPPNIEVVSPPHGSTITGSDLNITVRATDLNGCGFNGRSLLARYKSGGNWTSWFDIGEDVDGREVRIRSTFNLPFGTVSLQFKGSDLLGNTYTSKEFLVTMKAPVINKKPIPVIASPLNNSIYEYGRSVNLNAEGSVDDGVGDHGPLRFTWISSIDGVIGTVKEKDIFLSKGDHRITLYVDDGAPGHNVSVWVNISVVEPEPIDDDHPDEPIVEDDTAWIAFIVVLIIVIVTVVGLLLLMMFISRRKHGKELQLGVRTESEDDLEYNEFEETMDRERGFSIEDGEFR